MNAFVLLPAALVLGAAAGYLLNRLALLYLLRYTGQEYAYGGVVGRVFWREGEPPLAADMVLLETAAAILSAAAVLRWNGPELLFLLPIVLLILLLSLIDGRIRILPNQLNLAGVILGIGYAFFREGFTPVDAAVGIAVGGGFAAATALLYRVLRSNEGLGLGDVKLLAFFGSFAGWEGVLWIIVSGSLFGALWGIYAAAKAGESLEHEIPFGPFLGLAAIGYLLWPT